MLLMIAPFVAFGAIFAGTGALVLLTAHRFGLHPVDAGPFAKERRPAPVARAQAPTVVATAPSSTAPRDAARAGSWFHALVVHYQIARALGRCLLETVHDPATGPPEASPSSNPR